MPPRRSTRTAAPAAAAAAADSSAAKNPLLACVFALSDTFPGTTHAALKSQIADLGGLVENVVNDGATHLLTTEADFNKPAPKVKTAQKHGAHIVQLQWLKDTAENEKRQPEKDYLPGKDPHAVPAATTAASPPSPAASKPTANGKRGKVAATTAPPAAAAPATNGSKRKRSPSPSPSPVADGAKDGTKAASKKPRSAAAPDGVPAKPKKELGKGQVAKSGAIQVPVDEACPLSSYAVHIDDSGMIWDASLNQTSSSANHNKFYRLQLLRNGNDYKTWTRWGRVGVRGQTAILGSGSLADAIKNFEKKFKDKSGLEWKDRGSKPIAGKYAFVERSYDLDSDEDDEDDGAVQSKEEEEEDFKPPECTLAPRIKTLMELTFNQNYFAATMSALNYDAKKLPLGKLSKATISRGFETLKDLTSLFDDNSLAQSTYGTSVGEAIEQLSNSYYSVIPHAFGFNRPPIISDYDALKKEIELLESLSDMKDAELIMKVDRAKQQKIHPLDKQYQGLGMQEMTPLDHDGSEFTQLSDYLVHTRGATHNANYHVEDIFRIERNAEHDRFNKSPYSGAPKNRRLLWHGSRVTNFGGILSQGLRIAPPEAPVSGYMFGKGIYLADMSSKSANYCCPYNSGNTALLLLCEAELGDPIHELVDSSYTAGSDAKAKGMWSTWGQGQAAPPAWKDAGSVHPDLAGVKIPDVSKSPCATNVPGAYLLYNEFIVYDVAQIRLRYLFRVKMD